MTLRLAHFTPEYPPNTTGGLGTYLVGLVTHQHRCGDEVDVFFVGEEQAPPGTIHAMFQRDSSVLVAPSQKVLDSLSGGKRYDLVVCHDWAGIVTCRPFWMRGIPVVTTCHMPLAWDTGAFPDLPCPVSRELEFLAMARANRVIAVSRAVASHLQIHYPFTEEGISVVHHGTDISFFHPGPPIELRPPLLLYIGRYFENKGFDLLPDIFHLLSEDHPNLHLAVIGIGPLRAAVEARFVEMGLNSRVQFYDFGPRDVVRNLLHAATVVVVPSRHEAFGLVAIESMACGVPVVASNVFGLTEVITHNQDGLLVPPNNPAAFASAISPLIRNPSTAATMGYYGRAKVLRDFDAAIQYERTREVFLDVALREL